jgi:hypothetical protein
MKSDTELNSNIQKHVCSFIKKSVNDRKITDIKNWNTVFRGNYLHRSNWQLAQLTACRSIQRSVNSCEEQRTLRMKLIKEALSE